MRECAPVGAVGAPTAGAGVGSLTALTLLLVMEDPERFRKSREVGRATWAWCHGSASVENASRSSPSPNPLLRRLLVQSARYILGLYGPDRAFQRRTRVSGLSRGRNRE